MDSTSSTRCFYSPLQKLLQQALCNHFPVGLSSACNISNANRLSNSPFHCQNFSEVRTPSSFSQMLYLASTARNNSPLLLRSPIFSKNRRSGSAYPRTATSAARAFRQFHRPTGRLSDRYLAGFHIRDFNAAIAGLSDLRLTPARSATNAPNASRYELTWIAAMPKASGGTCILV
jgi:hypothetical protein